MGNYRFKLSDMMPNAWFYKLRDISRIRNRNTSQPSRKKSAPPTASQKPYLSQPTYSYQFTTEPTRADRVYNSSMNPKSSDTHFPDPPRKSSKRTAKRKTIYNPSPTLVSSSVSASCSCHATPNLVRAKSDQSQDYFVSPVGTLPELELHETILPEFGSSEVVASESFDGLVASDSFDSLASWPSSCSCQANSTADIIIDMNKKSFTGNIDKLDGFDTMAELELPPILTKPLKFNDMTSEAAEFRRTSSKMEEIRAHGSLSLKFVKEESIKTQKEPRTSSQVLKCATNRTGVKLRANSPRIACRKVQACGRRSVSSGMSLKSRRRSLSESFAIVKSSFDPQRDFRDSMVEMIVENNIRASKDLEELLACYLSLNSDEYHDLIIRAFEQIWFDMTDLLM